MQHCLRDTRFFIQKFSTEIAPLEEVENLYYKVTGYLEFHRRCDPTGLHCAGNCQRTLAPTSFSILFKILQHDISNCFKNYVY